MTDKINEWLDDNEIWKIVIMLSIILAAMVIVALFGQHKIVTLAVILSMCTLIIIRLSYIHK